MPLVKPPTCPEDYWAKIDNDLLPGKEGFLPALQEWVDNPFVEDLEGFFHEGFLHQWLIPIRDLNLFKELDEQFGDDLSAKLRALREWVNSDAYFPEYGIADSPEQIMEIYGEALNTYPKDVCVAVAHYNKPDGRNEGFRWYKMGDYIGTQAPLDEDGDVYFSEFFSDTEGFEDGVWLFDVLEIIPKENSDVGCNLAT